MNLSEYQHKAARTSNRVTGISDKEMAIFISICNLMVATGRLAEYVKKGIRHGHGIEIKEVDSHAQGIHAALQGILPACVSDGDYAQKWNSDDTTMALWSALGLAGESCELINEFLSWSDEEEIADEMGDVGWYWCDVATWLGLDLNDIAEGNIEKLRERYPEGFSEERSKNRA